MAMTVVVAVIHAIFSQRVYTVDPGMICINLVCVNVTVRVRFICHVPQSLGAHVKHRDRKQLADEEFHTRLVYMDMVMNS
jgi:hypothetical protein